MVFVRLAGGLGNQLFQLAAGKQLSLKTGKPLGLFTAHLANYNRQQAFRLQELIAEPLHVGQPNWVTALMLKFRINKIIPALFPSIIDNRSFLKVNKQSNFLLDDYFQITALMPDGINWLLHQISQAALTNSKVQAVFNQILKHNTLAQMVAVHIRRADYLLPANRKIFCYLENTYYSNALQQLPTDVGTLVVFSEEEPEQMDIFNNKQLIKIKQFGLTDTEEFLLLSLFKNYIIANSTFSFWAALAAGENNTCKIGPKNWTFRKDDAANWYNNLAENNFIIVE